MVEDFSGHPLSITEIKSDKTSNASDWTPRDVLIRALRMIDSGELDPDALIVCAHYRRAGEEPPGVQWWASSPDFCLSLGMLTHVTQRLVVRD